MKTSSGPSDLPDLERDLPTTPEDVRALRALREQRGGPGVDWMEQLQALHDQFVDPEARRRRRTFEGFEPFEL